MPDIKNILLRAIQYNKKPSEALYEFFSSLTPVEYATFKNFSKDFKDLIEVLNTPQGLRWIRQAGYLEDLFNYFQKIYKN